MKQRLLIALIGLGLAGATLAADDDATMLPRLLQYDLLLEARLSPRVVVCVDERMGKVWVLPSDDEALNAATQTKLRHAVESCTVSMNRDQTRLAGEIRAALERQLEVARRLEAPMNHSRQCVQSSTSAEGLKACNIKVTGKPPGAAEWALWRKLKERQ